jgi:hypothetical protein
MSKLDFTEEIQETIPEENLLKEILLIILGKSINKPELKRCIKLYLNIKSLNQFRGKTYEQKISYYVRLKMENTLFDERGEKKDLQTVLQQINSEEEVNNRLKQKIQEELVDGINKKNDVLVAKALKNGASAKDIIIGGVKYEPFSDALHKLYYFQNDEMKDIIRLLLEKGADPNGITITDTTPLMTATESGNAEIVRLLLIFGADPSYVNKSGSTVMNYLNPIRKGNEIKDIIDQSRFFFTMGILRHGFNNADFDMGPDLRNDYLDFSGTKRQHDDDDDDQPPPPPLGGGFDQPPPPLGGGFDQPPPPPMGGGKRKSLKQNILKKRKTRKHK